MQSAKYIPEVSVAERQVYIPNIFFNIFRQGINHEIFPRNGEES